jgi:small subunit ribosomal protein S16
MAIKIRLRRMGRKKQAHYRIVVADSDSPRDGRFVESLGHYKPLSHPARVVVDMERVDFWLGKGAEPTNTVASLLRKVRKGGDDSVAVGEVDKEAERKAHLEALAAKRKAEAAASEAALKADEEAKPGKKEPSAEAEEKPAAEAKEEAPEAEEKPAADAKEEAPEAEEKPAAEAKEEAPEAEEKPAAEAKEEAPEAEEKPAKESKKKAAPKKKTKKESE